MAKNGTYQVGYGRPPREHQFKKGSSGNRTSLPKKEGPSFAVLINRMLAKRVSVTVTENAN